MIKMQQLVGSFAENKDIAKRIRIEQIMPTLSKGKEVVINFDGVAGATQSFIHALISDPIREFRDVAYTNLVFKNANDDVRAVISIVYRYMQESLSGEENDQS
jgi:hypothetical protein